MSSSARMYSGTEAVIGRVLSFSMMASSIRGIRVMSWVCAWTLQAVQAHKAHGAIGAWPECDQVALYLYSSSRFNRWIDRISMA